MVDTNAGRVAGPGWRAAGSAAEAQAAADAALPAGRGWAWDQAVFDLGAARLPARGAALRRRARCGRVRLGAPAGCPEPDPALGSAGVSGGQSRFDGSDRQGRGRLVAALRRGPVPAAGSPTVMGWPDDAERAGRVAGHAGGRRPRRRGRRPLPAPMTASDRRQAGQLAAARRWRLRRQGTKRPSWSITTWPACCRNTQALSLPPGATGARLGTICPGT